MNFLAHSLRFLDGDPTFAVATGIPDFLTIAEKGVRLRTVDLRPFLDSQETALQQVAAGAHQHLIDDRRFHSSACFLSTSSRLRKLFKPYVPDDGTPRASFLGHLIAELLLDAELASLFPGKMEQYYKVLGSADFTTIEQSVCRLSRKPTQRLAKMLELFCDARVMFDYADDARLFYRVEQVMRRVGFPLTDTKTGDVFAEARLIVREQAAELYAAGTVEVTS